jgi:hypothetical protein
MDNFKLWCSSRIKEHCGTSRDTMERKLDHLTDLVEQVEINYTIIELILDFMRMTTPNIFCSKYIFVKNIFSALFKISYRLKQFGYECSQVIYDVTKQSLELQTLVNRVRRVGPIRKIYVLITFKIISQITETAEKPQANTEDEKPQANTEDEKPQAITEDEKPQANTEDEKPQAITEDEKSQANTEDENSEEIPEFSQVFH